MGPKKGKKKKKTPEEIAEENRIREEEERKALEAELARQEEERKRLEEEERIRQEKLSQQRTVELERLTGEEGDLEFHFSSFTRTLGGVTAAIQKEKEWKKYTECSWLPSAVSEAALNTYLAMWKEESTQAAAESKTSSGEETTAASGSESSGKGEKKGAKKKKKTLLGHALGQCAQCEKVVGNILKRKCELETQGALEEAERCVKFSILFRKEISIKLDDATKHIISCSEEFMGPKHEVNVSEANAMGVQYGIWCNITQRPFRMRALEFSGTSLAVDVPKPLATHPVAVRAIWTPYNDASGHLKSTTLMPVGGILHFDILEMPSQAKRIRKWTIRNISAMTEDMKRVGYPLSFGEGGSSATTAASTQTFRIRYKIPDGVWFDELKFPPKLATWNPKTETWDSEGLTYDSYDESKRQISFLAAKLVPDAHIALVRERYSSLPLQSWTLTPLGKSLARFELCTPTVDKMKILLGDGWASLEGTEPEVQELDVLVGSKMSIGDLLDALDATGICLRAGEDFKQFFASKGIDADGGGPHLVDTAAEGAQQSICIKDRALEENLHLDISMIAPSFAVGSSRWNGVQDSQRCVFQIQECTKLAESEEKARSGESVLFDAANAQAKTCLYEIDKKPEDLKQEVEGFDLKLGCKCSLVSTHEDDEVFSDAISSGEETHVRMWPFMVTKRASADTSARLESFQASECRFRETVRQLFDIIRPFSFA